MRSNRVLLPGLVEGEVTLRGQGAHHLRAVLRVRVGDGVEAFDGRGSVASATVRAVGQDGVVLVLGPARPSTVEAGMAVTVAVALLKADKLAEVVRPCTELGAAEFVLLTTRHCDVSDVSAARRQRLERVAEEAARQSGRARVPGVRGPVPLEEFTWAGAAIVADPRAELPFLEALARPPAPGALTLITGPEGGFAASEVDALVGRGATAVTLGPRVLRAETAPVALTAAVLLGFPPGLAPGQAPVASRRPSADEAPT